MGIPEKRKGDLSSEGLSLCMGEMFFLRLY